MKPADQLKVIALAFLAIVAMIGVITAVSLKTTEAVAGHHAAGAHGEAAGEHGDASHDTPKTNVDSMAQDQTHSDAGHEANQAGHADGGSKDMPGDQGAHQPADEKTAEHASEGKMAEHGDAKPAEHAADAKSGEHAADAKSAEHAADAKPAEHAAAPAGGNVEAGAKVFMAKTCATCHTVTSVKATGTIGPKLDGLSKVAATRKPGTAADVYIKESIENPAAFVVPNFQPMMPPLRSSMSDQEFKDLVAFLGSL